ncbi:MAG: YigZ family protein [Clostridiales bacterium]|nr:YigZ family protein [Clostridiales bacterium]
MSYFTLKSEGLQEYVVKRSRFIGRARPVACAQEALDFIAAVKSEHWDATHNVWAYSVRDGNTRRFSDDGEPQGTAGMPVLDVLVKEQLTDCVVVVTRYFGGVLLGTGGLVRAYSHSAKLAVDAAEIGEMQLWSVMNIECDYNFYGKLACLIPEQGGAVDDARFGENVSVVFRIPSLQEQRFEAVLTEACFGRYSARKTGEIYGF